MAFKDLLVHIDNSKQCAARLALAVSLARECEAQLTGIYVVTHAQYAPQSESAQLREAQAQELFLRQTAEAGIVAHWLLADWGTVGVGVAEILNYHAHCKDLVIIGQSDAHGREGEMPTDLPERVIAGSGRPVLVVPYVGSFSSVGRKVVVAWKNGRESARAVNDAMPFLLTAKRVSVVAIESSQEHPTGKSLTADICSHLERHKVPFRQETLVTGEIPVSALLMDYAWETGCDLLVVGVPRLAQNVGPVARGILDQMTVPVLMSY
jgi:nucleotide-binding universal stress UspA family protein